MYNLLQVLLPAFWESPQPGAGQPPHLGLSRTSGPVLSYLPLFFKSAQRNSAFAQAWHERFVKPMCTAKSCLIQNTATLLQSNTLQIWYPSHIFQLGLKWFTEANSNSLHKFLNGINNKMGNLKEVEVQLNSLTSIGCLLFFSNHTTIGLESCKS